MRKALGAMTRWLVFYFLPCYAVLILLISFFMVLTTGWTVVLNLWPTLAVLCVPAAGLIAASQAIPLSHRE